jgi:IS5 family transposase
VTHGGTVHPPRNRKGEDGNPPPTGARARDLSRQPELGAISELLDRNSSDLLQAVAQDLRRGLKQFRTGRDGMSAEQALRALVLKQIKNWSFRELRERIADGLTLRQFTRFGAASVPKHKAFHLAGMLLTPATVQALNALVVELALALGVEDACRVRME